MRLCCCEMPFLSDMTIVYLGIKKKKKKVGCGERCQTGERNSRCGHGLPVFFSRTFAPRFGLFCSFKYLGSAQNSHAPPATVPCHTGVTGWCN